MFSVKNVSFPAKTAVHSGHPLLSAGGGVEPPTKLSKRGALTGLQLLEGVAGKKGVTLFRMGCNFHIKIN